MNQTTPAHLGPGSYIGMKAGRPATIDASISNISN